MYFFLFAMKGKQCGDFSKGKEGVENSLSKIIQI